MLFYFQSFSLSSTIFQSKIFKICCFNFHFRLLKKYLPTLSSSTLSSLLSLYQKYKNKKVIAEFFNFLFAHCIFLHVSLAYCRTRMQDESGCRCRCTLFIDHTTRRRALSLSNIALSLSRMLIWYVRELFSWAFKINFFYDFHFFSPFSMHVDESLVKI